MRVSIVDNESNLFAMRVDNLDGSLDASLSEIIINDDDPTLPYFDSNTYEYDVILGANEWINNIEATVNDANATVETPEDFTQPEDANTASYTI
jgi:hypothetical protein